MCEKDEILEELWAAKEAYWGRFDHDLDKIYAHLKEQEKLHPERMSKLKPVPLRKKKKSAA